MGMTGHDGDPAHDRINLQSLIVQNVYRFSGKSHDLVRRRHSGEVLPSGRPRSRALPVALDACERKSAFYIDTMKTRLDRAGAKLAFDSAKIGERFYRGIQAGETSQPCRPAESIGG